MLNICVSGATGWTGRELVGGVLEAEDMTLASAVARQAAGQDVGAALGGPTVGVQVVASLEEAFEAPCDVLIDYTHPSAGKAHALAAIGRGISVVLGTTGLVAADFDEIDAAARAAGVGVATGNFCLTAALLQHFALFAARHLERFEVVDYAPSTKPDAPSGTAMELAELLDMALVPSYGHNDAVPNSHRLYVGPPGGRGAGEAGEAMNQADVIVALGSRLSQGTTGWNYGVINPETRIIQIDIDPQEVGRNYPVACGITGDA